MRRLALIAMLVPTLAACGGGSSGNGGGGSGGGTHLVGDLGHVDAELDGKTVVATAHVRLGGLVGKAVQLKYGVVDSLAGRVSQEERVVKRYRTTRRVVSEDVSVRFERPSVPSLYIVHWSLDEADGSFLDGADTGSFKVPFAK